MSDRRATQIYDHMAEKQTAELLEIWQKGDSDEWDDQAFVIVEKILLERLGTLPAQSNQRQMRKKLNQIERLIDDGRLDEALAECGQILQTEPEQVWAYLYRAEIYDEKGDLEQAMLDYQAAIRLDPEFKDAWDNMLEIERDLEEQFWDSPAMELLDQALVSFDEDNPQEALAACEKARAALPPLALAYNRLGLTLHQGGCYSEAIEAYLKAIAFNPRYYDARENLAAARIGQEAEAFHLARLEASIEDASAAEDLENAAETEGSFEDAPPLPEYVCLDETGFFIPGWPGHRTRPGRSGFDPLENDYENAHIQGVILRQLFKRQLRTRNPLFLCLMTAVGLIYSLPLIFGIPSLLDNFFAAVIYLIYYSPAWAVGGLLLVNVVLSLSDRAEEELI